MTSIDIPYIYPTYTTFLQCEIGIGDRSHIHIIGIPLEDTTSFRRGTRDAPNIVRMVSPYVEVTTSRLKNIDIKNIRDIGNIELVHGNIMKNIERIEKTIRELVSRDILNLLVIGGEHTLTYSIVKALNRKGLVIIFDAHLDSRDEWPYGQKYSHATHLRRIIEEIENVYVIHIGSRAYDNEELEFLRRCDNVLIINSSDVKSVTTRLLIRDFISTISNVEFTYFSLDFDVFDISYMPAVSNPEGYGGLDPQSVIKYLKLILEYCPNTTLKICDFVEYCPTFDPGFAYCTTVIKTILDFIDLVYLSSFDSLC